MESEGDEENHGPENIIITGDFEGEYETLDEAHQALNNSNPLGTPAKGKYYKQTYRTAWEQMPDFKGWLRGVVGEPTRAYCIYCQKTLHAHRLSLLKHTCTIRHQKAAQLHNSRKGKMDVSQEHLQKVAFGEGNTSTQDEEEIDAMLHYTTATIEEEQEHEAEEIEEEEDDDSNTMDAIHSQFQRQFRPKIATPLNAKPALSTHVIDTSKGTPVADLQVSLYKLVGGRWTYINEGSTNTEGRFSNFIDQNDFSPGRYKLHFDVDRYFELKKQDTLYPFIEIVFDCRSQGEHYHVPLLLSPYGYTTYRGSP